MCKYHVHLCFNFAFENNHLERAGEHCLRRLTNIKPTLVQLLVFSGTLRLNKPLAWPLLNINLSNVIRL